MTTTAGAAADARPVPRRGVRSALVLVTLVVACLAVGAVSGLSTQGTVDGWYADAQKVPWNPPNWVFGPAWGVLYVLMAVAAWRVWRVGGFAFARPALMLWVAQLCLNAAWSPIFFSGRLVWLALAVIVTLEAVLVATAVAFWRHDRLASWLLGPYLTWVAFATTLNVGLGVLN